MNINSKLIVFISALLVIILLLCLLDMPYGFYQLVRLFSTFSFIFFAYYEFRNNRVPTTFGFVFLAFLFQPFIKITLGRTIWNLVDIIVAIVLVIYIIYLSKSEKIN